MKAMMLNFKEFRLPLEEIREDINKNWRVLIMFALFFCGMLLGTSIYSKSPEAIGNYIDGLPEKIQQTSFSSIFTVLLLGAAAPLILAFFSGFSAIGLPVVLAIPGIFGTAISLINSYLYNAYKIDGVVFSLILILPAAVAQTVFQLLGCSRALAFSSLIAQNAFSQKKESRGEAKLYILSNVVILTVIIGICALQAACIKKFGSSLLL